MNPVLYWNAILLEASRRDFTRGFNNSQQAGPIGTSRAMAIVHIAIHDAVAFRNLPAAAYLNKTPGGHAVVPHSGEDVDAIICGAAVTTLKAMYPRYVDYFDDSNDLDLTKPAVLAAFNYGATIGNAVLTRRANDNSALPAAGPQVANPVYGQHRADPYQPGQPRLGPTWGTVTRFTGGGNRPLAAFPGFGTPSYPANPAYKANFDEVRDLGSATRGIRTPEQERIGVYWGYDGANNLGVPPRLYNQVARKVAAGKSLTMPQTAELFAMVNVAMADSGIDAWHWKYFYDLWRPVVGLRVDHLADGDCFWAPLGAPQTNTPGRRTLTPNFPAYPSGHATFGAALFQVLRLALTSNGAMTTADVLAYNTGTPAADPAETFTFVSDELDGIGADPDGSTRTRLEIEFDTYAQAVWENSVSRIYLGVHWRFDGLPDAAGDNIGGVPLGLTIGAETHALFSTGPSIG